MRKTQTFHHHIRRTRRVGEGGGAPQGAGQRQSGLIHLLEGVLGRLAGGAIMPDGR